MNKAYEANVRELKRQILEKGEESKRQIIEMMDVMYRQRLEKLENAY